MSNEDDSPTFSRCASKAEKLTIIPPLTIRQTESMARDIQGLSELHGMEKSEYIRHLVAQDKLAQERIWLARNQLFSKQQPGATNTAADSVRHES